MRSLPEKVDSSFYKQFSFSLVYSYLKINAIKFANAVIIAPIADAHAAHFADFAILMVSSVIFWANFIDLI